MRSLSQDVIDAKYGELEGLRRNTLRQLAKQHQIHRRNKLTADELRSRLLEVFPCTRHNIECMLVHYDGQSDSEQSDDENMPNQSQSISFAQPMQTPRTTDKMRSARRKTWNPVDVQIGSRLLTPRQAPPSSNRRVTMSVRQSFSIAALQQPSDDDDTPNSEKDEFEKENVDESSIDDQSLSISQSLLSFSCIDEDSDDNEQEEEQPKPVAIQPPPTQSLIKRRQSFAVPKTTPLVRKQVPVCPKTPNHQPAQSTSHPIVPPLVWPTKASSSTKSTNNENAAPASARRQTIGAPLKKFDVPTSRARAASSMKRPAAPLTDRSNTTASSNASNIPSCQQPTISAAAKAKQAPRRSMKASEHVVEKRSTRAGVRQAKERRASIEMKRTTVTRTRSQSVVQQNAAYNVNCVVDTHVDRNIVPNLHKHSF